MFLPIINIKIYQSVQFFLVICIFPETSPILLHGCHVMCDNMHLFPTYACLRTRRRVGDREGYSLSCVHIHINLIVSMHKYLNCFTIAILYGPTHTRTYILHYPAYFT